VEQALQKFLNDKLQLRSLGDVAFPDTVINRSSAPLILKAQNETTDPVDVVDVDIVEPTIFVGGGRRAPPQRARFKYLRGLRDGGVVREAGVYPSSRLEKQFLLSLRAAL
jgi:hypothetical protein